MARGDYIPKLQRSSEAKNAALTAAHQGLTDLIAYCQSDKFSVHHAVNPNDIILRVQEIKNHMLDVEHEGYNKPLKVKEKAVLTQINAQLGDAENITSRLQ